LHKIEGRKDKNGLYDAHEKRFEMLPNNGISKMSSKYITIGSHIDLKKKYGREKPIYHLEKV